MVSLHLSWLIKASSLFAILVSLTQPWADILKTGTEINQSSFKKNILSISSTNFKSFHFEGVHLRFLGGPSERQTVPVETHTPNAPSLPAQHWRQHEPGSLPVGAKMDGKNDAFGEFQEFWAIMDPGISEFSFVFILILWYMYACIFTHRSWMSWRGIDITYPSFDQPTEIFNESPGSSTSPAPNLTRLGWFNLVSLKPQWLSD